MVKDYEGFEIPEDCTCAPDVERVQDFCVACKCQMAKAQPDEWQPDRAYQAGYAYACGYYD